MDDMISRQIVINAIDTIESEVADGEGFQYEKWREYFHDLPSAQPDLCDGCDRYGASCVGEGCGKLEMSEVAKDTNVPINDCISRQDAIDVLSFSQEMLSCVLDDMDVVGKDRDKYSWGLELIESNIEDIKELPSAQTESPEQPKRGTWIKHEDRAGWCCSECAIDDYYAYFLNSDTGVYELQDKFCPNCGAYMRGEQDG